MSDQTELASDLLRGAAAIAEELFGESDRAAQRRVYHLQDQIPVFRLGESGTFFAFRSKLREHLQAKSLEKEAKIAATAAMMKPTAIISSHSAKRITAGKRRARSRQSIQET
jgi:hypothetical protein